MTCNLSGPPEIFITTGPKWSVTNQILETPRHGSVVLDKFNRHPKVTRVFKLNINDTQLITWEFSILLQDWSP